MMVLLMIAIVALVVIVTAIGIAWNFKQIRKNYYGEIEFDETGKPMHLSFGCDQQKSNPHQNNDYPSCSINL